MAVYRLAEYCIFRGGDVSAYLAPAKCELQRLLAIEVAGVGGRIQTARFSDALIAPQIIPTLYIQNNANTMLEKKQRILQ